ncbi:MAG: hypothetical protein A2033_14655 [Bacteroidetes bacterium GWA2_31_9]|nr:MAG: hypothetical protein A2033_14655 [Bacteroidetes bacterium GWA2_31_9]
MNEFLEHSIEIINQTIMVSGFVLYMMLIIEYINVRSDGKWSKPIKKSLIAQLTVSSGLGIIPGCIGIFTVVSLFTHNIIGFSGLLAGSIATIGDEAFVMLSMIPNTFIKTVVILFVLAFSVSFLTNIFTKKIKFIKNNEKHLQTHKEDDCHCNHNKITHSQVQKFSFHRALLIALLILIVLFQFFLGHDHHSNDESIFVNIGENMFFLIGSIVSIAIVMVVPEHFLVEHLWGHILKQHFMKIFLWTLGSMIIITFIINYFDIESWISSNQFPMLLIALIIGLIPISGPHIVFTTLFAGGMIPFSILLANTIVQEGHGGLPLLAESKRSFVLMKASKIVIALIIGSMGFWFGW